MKQNRVIYAIFVFALIMSVAMPKVAVIVYENSKKSTYETQKINELANTIRTGESTAKIVKNAEKVELAIAESIIKEEPKEEISEEAKEEQKEETKKEVLTAVKSYGEMTNEELINAILNGTFNLEYSKAYDTNTNGLTKSRGAIYYENHKETYYSQRVLPGNSLNIPGRHVADDGTIRDGEGYICVAANGSYLAKGSVVKTSLGPAKVYDSGCASGIIDIYTDW